MRVPPAEFLALDLDVHALLKDVPLRDVSVVDLPDGGDDRTIADVRRLLEAPRRRPPVAGRALLGLHAALHGRHRAVSALRGLPHDPRVDPGRLGIAAPATCRWRLS